MIEFKLITLAEQSTEYRTAIEKAGAELKGLNGMYRRFIDNRFNKLVDNITSYFEGREVKLGNCEDLRQRVFGDICREWLTA
jgi:hypothetical protein